MKRSLLAVTIALVGCASNKIEITQSRTASPGPFSRLAVFMSIPANGFDRGIYHGFQRTIASELAACGVEAAVVQGMPADRDGDAPTSDARLIIRAREGELATVTTVDQYGNVLDEKAFKHVDLALWLELRENKQKRVTWQAFANLHLEDSGATVGENFAHRVVARLRSDGVLGRCR